MLEEYGLIASRSAEGNCYHNAAMESGNRSIKVEATHDERFGACDHERKLVLDDTEVDYNRSRFHSTLGFLSPEQFELTLAVRWLSGVRG